MDWELLRKKNRINFIGRNVFVVYLNKGKGFPFRGICFSITKTSWFIQTKRGGFKITLKIDLRNILYYKFLVGSVFLTKYISNLEGFLSKNSKLLE